MKFKKILGVFLVVIIATALSVNLYSCNENATVENAILDIGLSQEEDDSRKYDLDEKFSCFRLFSANGEGWVVLNCEEGITDMIFKTEENDDGSVKCILKEIFVVNYGSSTGYLSTEETIKKAVGNDIEFTLILENNVVTSHDLPTLLPLE